MVPLLGVAASAAGSIQSDTFALKRKLSALVFSAGMIIGLALLLFSTVTTQAHADSPRPSFLRSLESRSSDLSRFVRWTTVIARTAEEMARASSGSADCRGPGTASCRYQEWRQFLHSLRGRSRWEQLVAVNGYVNARAYVPDENNWKMQDHWSTPGEFFARSGDCEDFAITKFYSLKHLGWTDDELRIAAVKDLKLGVGHAVLVVFLADTAWLLDNRMGHVTDLETIRHYQPVYSINESHWWVHRKNEHADELGLSVASHSLR